MRKLSTIATISRVTGIAKEVLRKWEERYGFPLPERDSSGHRAYPEEQTTRLKLIKRLVDVGMRPAHIVPLDEGQLQLLLQPHSEPAPPVEASTLLPTELLDLLRSRDRSALADRLAVEIGRQGLERFVMDVMAPLNSMVGAAWARGELPIRDEHLYSEVVQGAIRKEIAGLARPAAGPRLLITTPSGELHTLGILMVEAIASLHGAHCTSLGAQTPLDEIPHAVDELEADIVCLGLSAAFPKKRVPPLLKALRKAVPAGTGIWIGGAGASGLDRSPRGIQVLLTLPDLVDAIHRYKKSIRRQQQQQPSPSLI